MKRVLVGFANKSAALVASDANVADDDVAAGVARILLKFPLISTHVSPILTGPVLVYLSFQVS